ncbi:transposase [Nocardia noduli]|uniref:transposase n=1 Tax=Nocardia noduli TaxID=2815722 RepID=UPI003F68264B
MVGLYTAKTGVMWRDLREGCGSWKTVYNRSLRWLRYGTLGGHEAEVRRDPRE